MYSKIKRLRVRGARRSDREITSDPGVVGHLTMAIVGTARQLKVHGAGDDSQRFPVIPVLFDPVILAMGANRMLFAGTERQGDQADPNGQVVMQEWAVEIMVEPPARFV
jgi:hypothetical protein